MQRLLLSALIATTMTSPALAQQTVPVTEAAPMRIEAMTAPEAAIPADAAAARLALAQRIALNTELHARMEQTRKGLEALEAELQSATGYPERNAIQARIAEVKKEGRLDLLRIQMRHAQAAGRMTQANELATAIERILHPQIERAAVPVARTRTGAPEAGR